MTKVPVRFWSQDLDGAWIGWVVNGSSLANAATFTNFTHFENSTKSVRAC